MLINADPQRRDLVVFGVALPAFFALLGWLLADRTASAVPERVAWSVGAVVAVVYWVVPRARRPLFIGWNYLTYPLAWVVSHVVLLVVFVAVITPIALLLKLLRFDPLSRRPDAGAETYWVTHDPPRTVERYFRPY